MSTSAPVAVPPPPLAVLPLLPVPPTPPPRRPRRRVSQTTRHLVNRGNTLLTKVLLQRRRSPTRTWDSVSSTKEPICVEPQKKTYDELFSCFFFTPFVLFHKRTADLHGLLKGRLSHFFSTRFGGNHYGEVACIGKGHGYIPTGLGRVASFLPYEIMR